MRETTTYLYKETRNYIEAISTSKSWLRNFTIYVYANEVEQALENGR